MRGPQGGGVNALIPGKEGDKIKSLLQGSVHLLVGSDRVSGLDRDPELTGKECYQSKKVMYQFHSGIKRYNGR